MFHYLLTRHFVPFLNTLHRLSHQKWSIARSIKAVPSEIAIRSSYPPQWRLWGRITAWHIFLQLHAPELKCEMRIRMICTYCESTIHDEEFPFTFTMVCSRGGTP